MATIGNIHNITDQAKKKDPSGKMAQIAELLEQSNDVVEDGDWIEGNLDYGHQVTIRTSLPQPSWVGLNGSSSPQASSVDNSVEAFGYMELWNEINKRVADLGGDPNGARFDEIKAGSEGMAQEFAGTVWYGNTATAPKEFMGFAPRFNNLTGTSQSENIIPGGGAGADNASIWLVGWGPRSVHFGYPKGSAVGLKHIPIGEETAETSAGLGGTRTRVYRDLLTWDCGLVVHDWRFIARTCNIDVSSALTLSGANIVKLMIQMLHKVPERKGINYKFYMNKTLFSVLELYSYENVKAGGGLTFENVDGRRIERFQGVQVRRSDQLSNAESLVA